LTRESVRGRFNSYSAGRFVSSRKRRVPFHPEEKIMFTIPPNFILLVCAGIVGAVIGFLIYGFIKGFDKVFPEIE
jgi:hypothetical protein